MDVQSRERMEFRALGRAISHCSGPSPLDFSASVTAFQMTPLYHSTCPLPCGLYPVVRLVAMPCAYRNCLSSADMKHEPLSECMYEGFPNMAKRSERHFTTVFEVISEHGNANGNLEYSSTTVSMYLLSVSVGKGPLKSMLSLSKGDVALINLPGAAP